MVSGHSASCVDPTEYAPSHTFDDGIEVHCLPLHLELVEVREVQGVVVVLLIEGFGAFLDVWHAEAILWEEGS